MTASNSVGSGQATSAATAVVTTPVQPPVNTSQPTISGQTVVGDTLTAANGSWSNGPTGYSYQWQDCDSSGTNCSNISGATNSSYKLASGDAGDTIAVVVTASNSAGSGQATSAATGVVTVPVQPPVNTSLPTISGQTVVGDTLTRRERVVVERSDGLRVPVAGLRLLGCELLEHFGGDGELLQAGVRRCRPHDRCRGHSYQLGRQWSGDVGGNGCGDGSGAAAGEYVAADD